MAIRNLLNKQTATEDKDRGSTVPITIIEPAKGWTAVDFEELWHYRDLLYFLIWRDIKVRYKQTVLGAAWAVIQPFFTMVVFSIFFGHLAGISSGDVPYPIFAYAGLVPWTYFANALTQSSNSLVEQERVITKVYFPRLLVPMAPVVAGLLDFAIAFVVLIGMMFVYGITPTAAILTLPLLILLSTAIALAAGLWLAAINVQYRDVRYTIPFLIQLWLFATPVAYPASLVPEFLRPVFGLNPMVGVIEGFRWALLGSQPPSFPMLIVSALVASLLLVGGLFYFRRMEDSFADVI
jgi:lipopolysaccharide transport system permease protein